MQSHFSFLELGRKSRCCLLSFHFELSQLHGAGPMLRHPFPGHGEHLPSLLAHLRPLNCCLLQPTQVLFSLLLLPTKLANESILVFPVHIKSNSKSVLFRSTASKTNKIKSQTYEFAIFTLVSLKNTHVKKSPASYAILYLLLCWSFLDCG